MTAALAATTTFSWQVPAAGAAPAPADDDATMVRWLMGSDSWLQEDGVGPAQGEVFSEPVELDDPADESAYNLHIEEIHTYFVVVGDEEVLVHNTCPSRWNYRDLFRRQNPSMPAGYEVHHALLQKYESIMREAGVNIHENQFLRGVDATLQRTQITPAWTRWERSLGRTPTAQDITNFSYRIDELFGQQFIFGSP